MLAVAPGGNDANDGAAAKPFATLEAARDAIRALKKRGPLPAGGVLVKIADGTYPLQRTFSLTSEDSGTAAAPVVYQGGGGASCRFTGDAELKGFTKVSDPSLLARLPEEARGKVWQCPLPPAGIASVPPPRLGGFGSGRGFHTTPAVRLFAGDRELPLARWPNKGDIAIGSILEPDDHQIHGIKGSKTGRFTCASDRLTRWAADPDIILQGYWFWDWAESREPVKSINPETREITLEPPFHTYGYRPGQPFHATNLFSEIDQPGEWYLDRRSLTLYVHAMTDWPAAATPPDQAPNGLRLSLATFPAVVAENVAHLRFQGIAWTGGAADGVHLTNCRHTVLEGCRFSQLGGDAVTIGGGSDCGVAACDFDLTGRGGVLVNGGDRKNLAPGRHFVTNCHFHHLSCVDPTYTPAVLVTGVGHAITHNLIHDLPSSAIRLGGNDHVVAFNDVARVVLESDDQGAVDMWGDPTARGNVFRYNRWSDIGRNDDGGQPKLGRAAIRFDDAISGQLVEYNIFDRCGSGGAGFGAVQIHGGRDQLIQRNLFCGCSAAVSFSAWQPARWQAFVQPKFPVPELDRDLYLKRYPDLANLTENANANTVADNLAVNCAKFLLRQPPNTTDRDNRIETAAIPTGTIPGELIRRAGLDPALVARIGLYQDRSRPATPAPPRTISRCSAPTARRRRKKVTAVPRGGLRNLNSVKGLWSFARDNHLHRASSPGDRVPFVCPNRQIIRFLNLI